jgi:hypothetical protein
MLPELDNFAKKKLIIKDKELIRACCRAIYLWEFGEDDVDKKYRKSDKEMMRYFGGGWTKYTKGKRSDVRYTEKELKNLMHSCVIERQLNNSKIILIGAHLTQPSILVSHNYVLKNAVQLTGRLDTAKNLTDDLAQFLNLGKGNQPALASRVLFFAMPQLHFYNISQPLVSNLRKYIDARFNSIDDIYDAMHLLHEANKVALSRLPRPKFDKLGNLSAAIKDGRWWERRVLDLAVLENWDCFCKR